MKNIHNKQRTYSQNLFSIANYCFVNFSDLSKMLVKKQMKYFDVPLDHAWIVPVLQELLNTRTNNLYVEGFDDYAITEMSNDQCRLFVHNFAYFLFS